MERKEKETEIKRLKVKVRGLTNSNRRLKRKERKGKEESLVESMEESGGSDITSDNEDDDEPLSSSLLGVMSPQNRKKIFRRLSQETSFPKVKRKMRKEGHRINLRDDLMEQGLESEVRGELGTKVEAFLNEDANSLPCPDKDKVGVSSWRN